MLQPEVLHLGGKAGRVNYFRSRPEGAPLLGSGHRGQGVGSKRGFSAPQGVGEALGTLRFAYVGRLGVEGSQTSLQDLRGPGAGQRLVWVGAFPVPPTSPAYSPISGGMEG